MYLASGRASEPEFWDGIWKEANLETALRFCEIDPLRSFFERYAPQGTRLLEGGCGLGQYVVYYRRHGVRVLGLDFARPTLRRLRAAHPEVDVCAADVFRIPVLSQSVDCYFSGGVVEHFEAGPLGALLEARRVLKPGGTLLISIPYLSPLRWIAALPRRDRVLARQFNAEPTRAPGYEFWQYAFGIREFGRLLETSGFRVIETRPYAILHGLHDLPFASKVMSWLQRQVGKRTADRSDTESPTPAPNPSVGLAKRLLVSEDTEVPGWGILVRLSGWIAANMMLFVCRPEGAPRAAGGRPVATARRYR
jgi:SAM-dependent methyltransferase